MPHSFGLLPRRHARAAQSAPLYRFWKDGGVVAGFSGVGVGFPSVTAKDFSDATRIRGCADTMAGAEGLLGHVVSGRGEAVRFLSPPWVQAAVRAVLLATPAPGTLNLLAEPPAVAGALARWPYVALPAQAPGFCAARLLPVVLTDGRGRWARAVWIRPLWDGAYPEDLVELAAGFGIRQGWGIADGAPLQIRPWRPGGATSDY